MLSYDYWTRRFARDPKVIGRTFRMGNDLYEIVGVAEKRFTGTETGTVTDIFVPMMMKNSRTLASCEQFWLRTLVQLKPGVAVEPVREQAARHLPRIPGGAGQGLHRHAQADLAKAIFKEKLLLEPAGAGAPTCSATIAVRCWLSASWSRWCC